MMLKEESSKPFINIGKGQKERDIFNVFGIVVKKCVSLLYWKIIEYKKVASFF